MESSSEILSNVRSDLLSRDELREKFGIVNYAVFIAMLLGRVYF